MSKVGAVRDEAGGWHPAQTPADLRAGVEENLRTLGFEQVGAVNLRRTEHEMADEQRVPLADQLAEMVTLREEGKIGGVGISTAPLDDVDEAIRSAQITCVQNAYSLLARDDGGVLDRCIAAGIAFVPYFPLGSAFPGLPRSPTMHGCRRWRRGSLRRRHRSGWPGTGACRQHPAHPGHVITRPSRGEPRSARSRPLGRRSGPARRPLRVTGRAGVRYAAHLRSSRLAGWGLNRCVLAPSIYRHSAESG